MRNSACCLWVILGLTISPGNGDMGVTRVAVVQAGPVPFNLASTLEKAAALTADAAGRGAQVVVLPEAFVSGYPKGLDFGARVGSRSAEGRRDFRRYFERPGEMPSSP